MADRKDPALFATNAPAAPQPAEIPPPALNPEPEQEHDEVAQEQVLQAIAGAGSRNTELLDELSVTGDAPGQLANNHKRADFMEERLTSQKSEIEQVVEAAEAQLARHKKLRDSFARRIVYTLLSKKGYFDEKKEREEKAYYEALDKRHKAEKQLSELESDKTVLQAEARSLEDLAERHATAHAEIDSLYSSLFDGPTPGFPDEDSQEAKFSKAQAAHNACTEELKSAVRGVKAATSVKLAVERALFEHGRAVIELKSRLFSPSYLQSILTRSGKYCTRGLELSDLAVEGLEPSQVQGELAQSKATIDQCFKIVVQTTGADITWSRSDGTAAAEKIHSALTTALSEHKKYIAMIKTASEAGRARIRLTARALEDERQGLVQIRQGAFESTLGFGAAAPAYHECCDRAAGFESESDAQCAVVVEPVVEELPDLPPPDYAGDPGGSVQPQAQAQAQAAR